LIYETISTAIVDPSLKSIDHSEITEEECYFAHSFTFLSVFRIWYSLVTAY